MSHITKLSLYIDASGRMLMKDSSSSLSKIIVNFRRHEPDHTHLLPDFSEMTALNTLCIHFDKSLKAKGCSLSVDLDQFQDMSSLRSLTIRNCNITSTYSLAFDGMIASGLKSFVLENCSSTVLGIHEIINVLPSSLTRIDIQGFNGSASWIPVRMREFSKLTRLTINDSNPNLDQLTHMIKSGTSLKYLSLLYVEGSNTSALIDAIGNHTGLVELYLHGVNINGPIPDRIYNLTSLTSLQLSSCDLTGEISPSLSNLTKLDRIIIAQNPRLTGSLRLPERIKKSYTYTISTSLPVEFY